jgi:hypothetical protein
MGSISLHAFWDVKDLSLTYKGMSPVRRMVLRQSEISEPKVVRKKVDGGAESARMGLADVLNPSKEDIFAAVSLRDGDRPYRNAARLIEKMSVAQAAPRPGDDWINLFLVSRCRSSSPALASDSGRKRLTC